MNNKKLFVGFVIVLLFTATIPLMVSGEGSELSSETTRATQESYVLESAHPYTNNYDYTWTITKPGATKIRVHFTYIDVEKNYDFLYVYDYSGSQLHKLTGTYSSGGWSAYSNGDNIKVRLKTDYSVTKWGFKIDLIEYEGGGSSGGGGALTNGVTASSSLGGTGQTEMWYIDVATNALSMRSVLTCGSADYDLYGKLGSEPTTSSYDWRGYTSGGEDVTHNNPGTGRWYIMVRSYSGSGAYQLTVTVTYGSSGGGDGIVKKYAVLVGVSDYKAISDLSYCDEDVTDWYYHLVNNLGWSSNNIRVYGDGHTANYPKYTAKATEYNVKQGLDWLVSVADADDIITFVMSGHGSGNGYGSSYLCMWDCNSGESGQDGNLYDTEIQAIFQTAVANKIFIFLDACYSGGIGPELMNMPNSGKVYVSTTCTQNGYGYDSPQHNNGMWTYYFLHYSWQNYYGSSATVALESIFNYAKNAYPKSGGDAPQQFDGNTGTLFYLN